MMGSFTFFWYSKSKREIREKRENSIVAVGKMFQNSRIIILKSFFYVPSSNVPFFLMW